jgi:hypothetical protein
MSLVVLLPIVLTVASAHWATRAKLAMTKASNIGITEGERNDDSCA